MFRVYVIVADVAVVHRGANVAIAGVNVGDAELVVETAVPEDPPYDHVIECVNELAAFVMLKVYEVPMV